MSSYIVCKFWVFRREFLRNYRYVGLKLLKVTEIVIPFQYWEILFSSGNDKPMYPGYQMFFLACDEEGRYVLGQRPKTPVGHFLRLDRNRKPRMKSHWQMMRQKTVNKDSPSHYFRIPHNTLCCPPNFACYCPWMLLGKCSTPRSIWKQWFIQNLGADRVYYGRFENSQWSQVLTIICLYFRSNYTEMRRLERELYEINLLRKQAIDDQE